MLLLARALLMETHAKSPAYICGMVDMEETAALRTYQIVSAAYPFMNEAGLTIGARHEFYNQEGMFKSRKSSGLIRRLQNLPLEYAFCRIHLTSLAAKTMKIRQISS